MVNSMDFIFIEGLRGCSLIKLVLDEDDDVVDSVMDFVKILWLLEFLNVLYMDFLCFVIYLGVWKFVIDIFRDQELKK